MYTLKSMAIKAGRHEETGGAELSQTFVNYVEEYGRSFELGLATRNFLQHSPRDLMRMASMGWGMLSRSRIDLTPERIKNLDQLQKILARAKEIEEVMA
jgi:heterodisulfide reductase subunit C/quinone-modifying oxidoreductase subunit QmoC